MVSVVYDTPRGRAGYPPLLMVKAMLLAEWYELSDEQLEQALWDRISFRRFVGLGLDEDAPDRSTVSRFRLQLVRRGLAPRLFAELNRQLER
ncbi:MAG: transposase [Chloroflexota bacterium]|nr:transposase [Chloroflexota bacterium]